MARIHYEHGMEYSLFLLLIIFALLSAQAQQEVKKSIKQTNGWSIPSS